MDARGIKIFLAVGVVLAAMVISSAYLKTNQVDIDRATFCPLNTPVPHTVVLVDRSDVFSPNQEQAVSALMRRLLHEIDVGERLSLFILDYQNYANPKAVFSMCNPGRGEQANALYQNPAKLRRRFVEFFEGPMTAEFERLKSVEEAPRSPVMEIIRAISLLPEFGADLPRRRLIVVSDLIQNMPEYSQYKESLEFAPFIVTDYGRDLRAALRGVAVDLIYLQRPRFRPAKANQHINFWRDYFQDAGAILGRIDRIR